MIIFINDPPLFLYNPRRCSCARRASGRPCSLQGAMERRAADLESPLLEAAKAIGRRAASDAARAAQGAAAAAQVTERASDAVSMVLQWEPIAAKCAAGFAAAAAARGARVAKESQYRAAQFATVGIGKKPARLSPRAGLPGKRRRKKTATGVVSNSGWH